MLVAICGLALLSNLANLGHDAPTLPKSQQVVPPSVVRPESLRDFAEQETAAAAKLKKQAKLTEDLLAKARGTYDSLLPCNATLAGTRGASADGTPIVCGADGVWRADPTATPAARDASAVNPAADQRARRRQAAADEAQRLRTEHEHRRQQALSSATLAVDFTDHADRSTNEPLADRIPAVEPPQAAKAPEPKESRAPNSWAAHTGKLYKIFEGTLLETVLTNRINGAAAGPINTMVTTDVWSHDHQKLLIPQGTRCLGTVSAVNSGYQQRLFVAFHRCLMPDGYPLELDRFAGLNQVGETGLRDLVNHHYLQIFGASLAVGAVSGLAQIGNSSNGFAYDPGVALRNGISAQTSQEAIHLLDHFLNQLPTFIVRERARVKIYLTGDLDVPAYDSHSIDPTL